MTDITKATSGPWSIGRQHEKNACAYIVNAERNEIATLYGFSDTAEKDEHEVWKAQPIRDADAFLIVEAVNAFDSLKARVAELEGALLEIVTACEEQTHPGGPICWTEAHVAHLSQIAVRARAALSAVRNANGEGAKS